MKNAAFEVGGKVHDEDKYELRDRMNNACAKQNSPEVGKEDTMLKDDDMFPILRFHQHLFRKILVVFI